MKWIYNPVLADTGGSIFKQLNEVIHPGAARRDYFNDPIRCSIASSIIQLIRITDNRNIRFHIRFIVIVQKDRKGCRKDLTDTMTATDVFPDFSGKVHDQTLMHRAGRDHIIKLSVYQFRTFAIRKRVNIMDCMMICFNNGIKTSFLASLILICIRYKNNTHRSYQYKTYAYCTIKLLTGIGHASEIRKV